MIKTEGQEIFVVRYYPGFCPENKGIAYIAAFHWLTSTVILLFYGPDIFHYRLLKKSHKSII